MGPSVEELSNKVATFAVTCQHSIDTSLVVEVPGDPPVLTPGLARVLGRILVKATRSAGSGEVRGDPGSEVLAS